MRKWKEIKVKKSWYVTAAAFLAGLMFYPGGSGKMIGYAGLGLAQFLWNLIPVFICVGLMDVWIERDRMLRLIGAGSGLKGSTAALLMGMVTAVPIYALLPIAGMLLNKGGRLANVLIFLCASASIRIPLLLFEASSLGVKFALCRFLMNLAALHGVAFLTERLAGSASK